jgi:hypothetical protein
MLTRARLAGLVCLLVAVALPAAAQGPPIHRVEARMESASIPAGGSAQATLEATRICPGDAVVLPEATAEVALDVPAGIAATGPGSVTFPHQVCASDPRATASLRLRVEAAADAPPGLHRVGITLRAPTLMGPPDVEEASLAFTVVAPAGGSPPPGTPIDGASHATPPSGLLAALAALGLAAAARRR